MVDAGGGVDVFDLGSFSCLGSAGVWWSVDLAARLGVPDFHDAGEVWGFEFGNLVGDIAVDGWEGFRAV